jgi:uncharacterized membrane protein YdbT with pleckstrin-like domain
MTEIDARLISGEEVILETKKHWFAPVADSKWAILMIIGALLLAAIQPEDGDGVFGGFFVRTIELIRLGLFFGGVGWTIYNVVAWRTAYYAVTNRRVLCREGLLRSRSTDTLLTSIADLRTNVSAIGRMLGFGTIRIMSASGEAGSDEFTSVQDVEAFKRQILEQKTDPSVVGEASSTPASATSSAPSPAPAASAADMTATLGELAKLRDAGAITPEEYEAKKAELLSRI